MHGKKRGIEGKELLKAVFSVLIKFFVVLEQEKTAAFEELAALIIKLSLLFSSEFIDGFIHQCHDMIAIEDNRDKRKVLLNGRNKTGTHIHCNGLEFGSFSFQRFQKSFNVLAASSLNGMQDPAGFQIHKPACQQAGMLI